MIHVWETQCEIKAKAERGWEHSPQDSEGHAYISSYRAHAGAQSTLLHDFHIYEKMLFVNVDIHYLCSDKLSIRV